MFLLYQGFGDSGTLASLASLVSSSWSAAAQDWARSCWLSRVQRSSPSCSTQSPAAGLRLEASSGEVGALVAASLLPPAILAPVSPTAGGRAPWHSAPAAAAVLLLLTLSSGGWGARPFFFTNGLFASVSRLPGSGEMAGGGGARRLPGMWEAADLGSLSPLDTERRGLEPGDTDRGAASAAQYFGKLSAALPPELFAHSSCANGAKCLTGGGGRTGEVMAAFSASAHLGPAPAALLLSSPCLMVMGCSSWPVSCLGLMQCWGWAASAGPLLGCWSDLAPAAGQEPAAAEDTGEPRWDTLSSSAVSVSESLPPLLEFVSSLRCSSELANSGPAGSFLARVGGESLDIKLYFVFRVNSLSVSITPGLSRGSNRFLYVSGPQLIPNGIFFFGSTYLPTL